MNSKVWFLHLLSIVHGLRVNNVKESYSLCQQFSQDHMKPWRARALCSKRQVDRLSNYLNVSRTHSESFLVSEESKKKKKKKKKKKHVHQSVATAVEKFDKNDFKGTKIFQGKFCAAGDRSAGTPIATVVYGFLNEKSSFEVVFKIAETPICFYADCSGRCDLPQVDPSVKFECIPQDETEDTTAKHSRLKAVWFVQDDCAETVTDTVSDAKSYYYTADEVKIANSGAQGRFCWDVNHDKNPEWNPLKETDPDYYSYSTNQKLPTCPPPVS